MKPRRSILSVPGHVEKMHVKAKDSDADVIMLDLEDSVPVDAKEKARAQVIRSITSMDWSHKTLTFRINALDTPYGYRDLLEVAEAAADGIDSVVIPKVNTPADIHFAAKMLDGIEMHKQCKQSLGIEASIETATGLENITQITAASQRIKTLVFGIADYSASVGARLISISGHGEKEEDIYPGHRWHFPLSRIVMAAKSKGIMAIDAPYGNFKDPDGLKRSAAMSCALGCDGKWAIHPGQIQGINQVFTPDAEDIERAAKVLAAYKEAKEKGLGATAVDGRMVDRATVQLAEKLVAQAKHLKLV